MIIYKDIFTDAELFSDSFKHKLIDDLYYEVDGKIVSRKAGSFDDFIGSNPSAEEVGEGMDDSVQSGIDVVLNHNLIDVQFDKKQYTLYLKEYMKNLIKRVTEEKGEEYANQLKEKLNKFYKEIIFPNLKDFDYYVGENFDESGMVILKNYREDGVTPYFIFLKDGLIQEKF